MNFIYVWYWHVHHTRTYINIFINISSLTSGILLNAMTQCWGVTAHLFHVDFTIFCVTNGQKCAWFSRIIGIFCLFMPTLSHWNNFSFKSKFELTENCSAVGNLQFQKNADFKLLCPSLTEILSSRWLTSIFYLTSGPYCITF